MLKKLTFVFVLLLLTVACGQTETPAGELEKIRLPMGFIPDPQYAPYYAAVENGHFADAGFEIEFDYSFETDGLALVGAGELPFAVVSGEQVLLGRANGLPVVYVMEWFQKYPIAIVSKAAADISEPADLAGRTIGLPGFFGANYVGYVGLLSSNSLTQDEVTANEIGFTQYEAIRTDQVEAAVVYVNNEPVRLAQDGEDVNVIKVADYIDIVANGIVTNEALIASDPDKVERFVHALLRGLADTLDDPDAAYELSKNFVEGLDDSRISVLQASLPLWEAEQLGHTDPDSWWTTMGVLMSTPFLSDPLVDVESAYTNQFVDTFER